MLDHRIDAPSAPAVGGALGGLEPFHVGARHLDVQFGIFSESAVEAAPARLRREVDLRAEGGGNAEGAVFRGGDHAEGADDGRIEGGGEAQRCGPQGDLPAGAGVELRRRAGFVARVGGIVGWDAVPEPFHEGLHAVVPAGGDFRRSDAGHEHGPQVVFFEEFPLPGGDRVGGDALVPAVEHQAGDFFDAELGGQVFCPFAGGLPPVLVDVQFTVAVEILEDSSVPGEQGGGADAERGAAILRDEPVAVGLAFQPAGTAGGGCESEDEEQGDSFHQVRVFR